MYSLYSSIMTNECIGNPINGGFGLKKCTTCMKNRWIYKNMICKIQWNLATMVFPMSQIHLSTLGNNHLSIIKQNHWFHTTWKFVICEYFQLSNLSSTPSNYKCRTESVEFSNFAKNVKDLGGKFTSWRHYECSQTIKMTPLQFI